MLKLRLLCCVPVLLLSNALFAASVSDVPGLIAALNDGSVSTIDMSTGVYTVTAADNYWYGPNAFPAITRTITINGNGSLIQCSTKGALRFFYVSGGFDGVPAGNLTLTNLELKGGLAQGGNGGRGTTGGGGGAGLGGAIFNQGSLTLSGVTLDNNQAAGGSGGAGSGGSLGQGGGGGLFGSGGSASLGSGGGGGGMQFGGTNGNSAGPNTGGSGGGFVDATQGGTGGAVGVNGAGGTAAAGPLGGNGAPGAPVGASAGGIGGGGGGFLPGQDGSRSLGGGFGQTGGHLPAGNPNGDGGDGASAPVSNANGGGGAFGGGGGGGSGAMNAAGGGGGIGGGGGGGGSSTGASGGGGFGGGGGGTVVVPSGLGGFGGGGGGNGGTGGFGAGAGGIFTTSGGGGGAGLGGAIFNHFGTLNISNSTFTTNNATGGNGGTGAGPNSGGAGGSGYGAAVFNLNGTVTVLNCTLAANTVAAGAAGTSTMGSARAGLATTADGGAIFNLAFGNNLNAATAVSVAATISNSILATTNTNSDLVVSEIDGAAVNTSSANISANNLVMTQNTFGGGTITGTAVSTANPNLLGLSNNGGPVLTMLPLRGSPAIDAGSNTAASGLATDQRGVVRVYNSTVDLGAVETEYALLANAGDNQFATVNTAYFTNLQIKAEEVVSGFVFTGVAVTFTVPSSGASGTFASSPTGFTDKLGLYTAPALTANTTAGAFLATCTATGFTPATFHLTNLAGAPLVLKKVAGDNQSASFGTAVAIAPKVQVTDSFGNPVQFVNMVFTVTGGGGSVTGASPNTDANGFASVGSWTLGTAPGTNTLLCGFGSGGMPGTLTEGPLTVTFTATSVNLPPVIDSSSYSPAPATVNSPVLLMVAAHDPEGVAVTYSFDYGDGSTGTSFTHTYATPGTFTVTISVSDGVNVTTGTLQVVVNPKPTCTALTDLNQDGYLSPIDLDSDCDGFADYLEILGGTDPFDPKSTLNFGNPAGPAVLFGMTLDIMLYPKLTGQDKFSATGYLPIAALPSPVAGSTIIFDVGGFAQKFRLNARGYSGSKANQTFALVVRPVQNANGTVLTRFYGTAKQGSVAPFIYDNAPKDANGYPDHVVVTIIYNGVLYRSNVPLHFRPVRNGGIKAIAVKVQMGN